MSLLSTILEDYELDPDGLHGVGHWARVFDNGLRLVPLTGAHPMVVTLFALFHDSRRVNECDDPDHGKRGATLAKKLRPGNPALMSLDDDAFGLLVTACTLHTSARSHPDPTVATCFDADRLDLPRCGFNVDPKRLCTAAARDPRTIEWAHRRSIYEFKSKSVDTFDLL
jgi:uncharacterized protein